MRKLKVINHMSLDGVIQNSPEDGFPYTDWGGPYRVRGHVKVVAGGQ